MGRAMARCHGRVRAAMQPTVEQTARPSDGVAEGQQQTNSNSRGSRSSCEQQQLEAGERAQTQQPVNKAHNR